MGGIVRLILGLGLALLSLSPLEARALAPHYLCAENRTLRDILLKRWAPYEFPIKVYLPAPPPDFVPDPRMPVRAVLEAFKRWNQAWPYLTFQYVAQPSKDGMNIKWFNQLFTNNQGRWGEAYLPEVVRGPNHEVLHWSELHLSVRAHPGSAFGTSGTVLLSEPEIRDLAIHEIGHALGLIHSDDGNDVMGGNNYYLTTVLDKRNISPRDIATVKFLYSLSYKTVEHPCPGGRFK